MLVAIIISASIGFLLILFFILLFGLYRYTFYSPKKWQLDDYNLNAPLYEGHRDEVKPMIDHIKSFPYEDVFIKSFDKLRLHARLFENKQTHKVAILFHGYRGTGYRDFSGGAVEAINMGYTVILIDERAHGQSQGHSITFGVRESKDLLSWADYAKNRFGQDIELVAIGISMGGATVLLAADKIGDNVKIIADCPFSSPKIMLSSTIRSLGLPVKVFFPILNLSSIIFGHTNLSKATPYESIKNTNNKILIIHGDKDTVVDYKISQDLANTFKDKIQYELFPGADHGMSYLVDKKRYQRVISDFLSK